MKYIDLPKSRLRLVCFYSLIQKCEVKILKDLDKFDLLHELSLTNKNVNTVISYYILKEICDYVIDNESKQRTVFYIAKNKLNTPELYISSICEDNSYIVFLHKLAKKLNTLLPILFYFGESDLNELETQSGDSIDTITDIIENNNLKSYRKFTFEKIKKYAEQSGLAYIYKEYLNSIRITSLLYK